MDQKNLNILIVDDEPELLELLSWDFEENEFNVFKAECPSSAMKVVIEQEIDYVLTDLKMKNGTGIDLLSMIHEKGLTLKAFYIMTGYTDVETQELRDIGLTKVFNKPLSPKNIIDHIHSSNV
jgi:DNA-binding NtrC family response regulator